MRSNEHPYRDTGLLRKPVANGAAIATAFCNSNCSRLSLP
ncbi:hypothetical protein ACPOL_0314 [Acidisarcina polymorpha]|uniref:Uncharacterized protein n=1 Tax=Acidisarcina polymorpha TaxID=2211140 RepID=A0A2Z5FT77_9BACT|nr:hypothetical protein ACPOL_0314 [Acidisarcina polymorpha]